MRHVGLTAIGLGLAAVPLHGQAVTGAAIWGSVTGPDSAPIAAAVVLITNTSNGERWQAVSFASGRYYLDNLSVGGPYRIDVRAIGYMPARRDSVVLSLGQRFTADFTLQATAIELEAITVTAGVDPLINAGRTGPAQILAESTIARLPVKGRDFSQLALLSPQVVESPGGGLSIAGQPDRLNSFQVDGATNNELFGSGGSGFSPVIGTVGSIGGAHSLSVEAVRELQVVTAPFDVRYGNFAAGLINAVTKSGSNRLEGSVVSYLQSEALSGKDTTGSRGEGFTNEEIGVAVGGPLVQNRLAWFVNADLRRSLLPNVGPVIGTDTVGGADSVGTGFRYASVKRFQDILRNTYGVDAGTFVRHPLHNPARNAFAKLTAQLGINSRLELSHNYVFASDEVGLEIDPYFRVLLSSLGFREPSTTNATRLSWTALLGGAFTNDVTLAYLRQHDTCEPASRFARVQVRLNTTVLRAGTQAGCGGSFQNQDLFEVTENLTRNLGAHRVTVGTHDEIISLPGARGSDNQFMTLWTFNSLDSLEQGVPARFRAIQRGPTVGSGPVSDLRVNQVGFYVQDQWTPMPRLTVTAGLRFDAPFLPTPPRLNPTLLADLGINTSTTPSGNLLWSPRVGFNYDFTGRGDGSLRGGIGLFAGRPAYKWFNGVYVHTGLEEVTLDCSGAAVPAFTIDNDNQPTTCGAGAVPPTKIMAFDPAFRFPRNLKIALGVDRRLPAGVVGTVDVLYTHGVDQFYLRDLNLPPPAGVASGEGGRALYGTIDPSTGEPAPARRSQNFGSVVEITNAGGDRALSLTTQLQRRFRGGIELNAAYTYTDARDRLSATEEYQVWDLGFNPIDGTLEDRRLTTSLWSVPHKVTILGAVDLPLKFRFSLIYSGRSGAPFTYVVAGDANADGLDNRVAGYELFFDRLPNDVVYVPRNASDITLATPGDYAALDRFIQGEPCLREQRGRLTRRNSCRNPWINTTTARVSKALSIAHGQSLEVTADLFNVLNFLNGDWGLVRQSTDYFDNYHVVRLLELVGYDSPRGRGIYNVLPVNRKQIVIEASRWRLQLGARYTF